MCFKFITNLDYQLVASLSLNARKENQILYFGEYVKTVILVHHMIILFSRSFSTTYEVLFQRLFLSIFTHWNKSITINIWTKMH